MKIAAPYRLFLYRCLMQYLYIHSRMMVHHTILRRIALAQAIVPIATHLFIAWSVCLSVTFVTPACMGGATGGVRRTPHFCSLYPQGVQRNLRCAPAGYYSWPRRKSCASHIRL